jgi:hypothetical protein
MSNRVIEYSIFALIVIALAFCGFCLVKVVSTDGQVDYCYVDNINGRTGGYEVIGHRPWRPDAHLGVASSPDSANVIMADSNLCAKK